MVVLETSYKVYVVKDLDEDDEMDGMMTEEDLID